MDFLVQRQWHPPNSWNIKRDFNLDINIIFELDLVNDIDMIKWNKIKKSYEEKFQFELS